MPSDSPSENDLLSVVNLMRSRTETFAEQILKVQQTAALESFRTFLQANNQNELLKQLPNLEVTFANWPMQGLMIALTNTMLLSDLHLKLIVPPPGIHFIASDHPVVLFNQAFVNILRDRSVSGLAMRGLQLFLPLSPDLLMLAFDPVCYRVGRPDRRVIHIDRKEDVELINALQVLNANQCLYFRDEADEPVFRKLLFKFRSKRPAPRKLFKQQEFNEGGKQGMLLAFHAPTVPLPGIWSFCKVRRPFKPTDFVERDPVLVHLHKEYVEDCRRRKELLPFGKWFAQKHGSSDLR